MDGEPPDVYETSTPKAKKQHRCCECRGFIEPGEKYQRFRGLWDGSWSTYKTCIECDLLRKDVRATLKHYEGPCFGDLFDFIFEHEDDKPDHVFRFMDIRRKRNAPESPKQWMEEREEALKPLAHVISCNTM